MGLSCKIKTKTLYHHTFNIVKINLGLSLLYQLVMILNMLLKH